MCDKSFFDKGRMTRHMASTHEGKQAFTCKVCEKSFSAKSNMERHISTVHEEVKAFKCKMCKKASLISGTCQNT